MMSEGNGLVPSGDVHPDLFRHMVSLGQHSSIGSVNGLAPNRRQAIIWTNDGKFTDEYIRHSLLMS